MGPAEMHRLFDAGELGILLHLGEERHKTLVRCHHGLRIRREMTPADQNGTLDPQFLQDRRKLSEFSLAEPDFYRLGVNKLICHRCYPQWR